MTDDEIEQLLRAGDGPRSLTPGELARLRERLGVGSTSIHAARPGEGGSTRPVVAAQDSGADGVDVLMNVGPERSARWGPRRVALVVAAAAAVVVLVVGLAGRTRSPAPEIDAAAPTTTPTPSRGDSSEACSPEELAAREALVAWGTVENWAFTGGSPDLATLVHAVAVLDESRGRERASERRAALNDDLAHAEAEFLPLARATGRQAAVEAFLQRRLGLEGCEIALPTE